LAKLILNGATSGSVTLESPAVSGTTTLTLPTTTGTVLTTTSPKAGNVIQVVQTTKTDTFSTTSSSYVDVTGLSVSITPTSSSSKILVFLNMSMGFNGDTGHGYIQLCRGGNAIFIGDTASNRNRATFIVNFLGAGECPAWSICYVDNPASTSSQTYNAKAKTTSASGVFINRSYRDNDGSNFDGRAVSSIIVMEIAG
jgi:hypothetical protein